MTKPVKIAYLEISPRQTGKTQRLVSLANELSAQAVPVVFVCFPGLVQELQTAMPNVTVLADGEPLPPGIDKQQAVWFYDEFDWLKSTVIREGGYYATTAARLREAGALIQGDMLMDLLKANGMRHERHLLHSYLWEFVRDHRAIMSPEQFRLSMLGEFQQ
ncbi:hypothetical protein [Pseudomonas protegens]|uniref:hypothetical protein n=1 Tax=Pseudomonas protegens TaxID=380021 RepID=UPI00276A1092|nr:hypothetical protein [Pseudomonas protegens]MDP9525348.1 hypothetical protein [Pseudomonas protegens]